MSKLSNGGDDVKSFWYILRSSIYQLYSEGTMTKKNYMNLVAHTIYGLERETKIEFYNRLENILTTFLKDNFNGKDYSGEPLLEFYVEQWKNYQRKSKMLRSLLNHFNNHFVLRQKGKFREIYSLTVYLWRENIFNCNERQVRKAALELLERARDGENVNILLIGDFVDSYIEMDYDYRCAQDESKLPIVTTYRELFEKNFLEQTERYLVLKSQTFLASNSVCDYVHQVNRMLEVENRVALYLHPSSRQTLLDICQRVLIENHRECIHNEFQKLLIKNERDNIRHMYSLLSLQPNDPTDMALSFQRHVTLQGMTEIEMAGKIAHTDPEVYFKIVWNVYTKYKAVVASVFENAIKFVTAFQKGCYEFIKFNAVTKVGSLDTKSAEIFAEYCNILLKKGMKNSKTEKLEEELDCMMVMFQYIENKDVFRKYYHLLMAKRLMRKKSANQKLEEYAITKFMQADREYVFGGRQLKMLNDVKVNRDFNRDFKRKGVNSLSSHAIKFTPLILSSGIWPSQPSINCSLPYQLQCYVESFTAFHASKYKSRKLDWYHNLSEGELVTNCFDRPYTFRVSTLQMVILLCYNEALVWTASQLAQSTLIQMEYLLQILMTLVNMKLLLPDDENLKPASKLYLNTEYSSKKHRLNIKKRTKLEQAQEQNTRERNFEQNRIYSIQSAIVRIMKKHKQLHHQNLLTEVVNSLSTHFKPCTESVKSCISILIEKEYIEKDGSQPGIYNYLP